MFLNVDIGTFISWFISTIISLVGQCLGILKSIEFLGTNLLNVFITITILNILVPILVNIAKKRGSNNDN